MKNTIIFDWNGTLIDDVDLCLELLNRMLEKRHLQTIELKKYKEIFTFPVKDYYVAAGFDFSKESFESLAPEFMDPYVERYIECNLTENTEETLKQLKERHINMIILSATRQDYLIEQVSHYHIESYFNDLIGIKDIHAKGKIDEAMEWMKNNHLNKEACLMVGDSIHDKEVADALGIDCILVATGHQSKERLMAAEAPVIDNLSYLSDYIK